MDLGDQTNKTVLDRFAELGVNVNGLVIPGRLIENTLARHALNLVINNNDDETFRIFLMGSATAVRYKNREIMLVTQHQLKGIDESQVAMMTDSGSHVITSGGRRGYHPNPDSDANDIIAFDFTELCKDWPELKPRFFNLTHVPPDVVNVNVLAMLLVGCPAAVQKYEIHENNHLGLARFHVTCLPHSQPSDSALLTVKPTTPLEINPDGMSGGAAFVIQYETGEPHAFFAGLIVRGGRDYLHILKAGVVLAFLDSVFPT